MKIILLDAVKNLGMPGDIVNVKDGFAKNYLFPKKYAKRAIKGALREIESIKKRNVAKIMKLQESASGVKTELEKAELSFTLKMSSKGTLFGSVSEKDIYAKIVGKYDSLDIDKKDVIMDKHIKEPGEFTAKIRLFHDITADIKITVIGEE
ncbi:50S ribosomal protein L9 [bacterium]|nr:50S ribosomal protein L9 [bacterium]